MLKTYAFGNFGFGKGALLLGHHFKLCFDFNLELVDFLQQAFSVALEKTHFQAHAALYLGFDLLLCFEDKLGLQDLHD